MRGVAIALSLLVGASLARAEVIDMPAAPPVDPDRGNFWRDMLYPHKDEVDTLVRKADAAIRSADQGMYGDYDPTGTERIRFFRETFGPLRYARKLAPDNIQVLAMLGHVADEHGRTREALEALHSAVDQVGAEKAGIEVTGRLGMIYLRLGKLDDAIRYLRIAQGPVMSGQPLSAHVLVSLATALSLRGQMSEAIDVLSNSASQQNIQYYSNELLLVLFALAVMYDRDDQPGAAFDLLDKMQNTLQGQIANNGQYALMPMRFSPAIDRHYYYGLLYETSGHLSEARAEFALYAAAGDQPFRRRALEHVTAIDKLRRNPPPDEANAAGPQPPPTTYRRRKVYHP